MTARLVNELSDGIRKVLEDHPLNLERVASGLNSANVVLLRGCGCRIKVPGFQEMHGMKACLVAPTKIIAGLGMSFDVDCIEAKGATGYYDSAFHNKATTMSTALMPPGLAVILEKARAAAAATAAAAAPVPIKRKRQPEGGVGAAAAAPVPIKRKQQLEDGVEAVEGDANISKGGVEASESDANKPAPLGSEELGSADIGNIPSDDTGHDRRVQMKVLFLEVVDKMVAQIIRRLWEAESSSGSDCPKHYTIAVTGDHSTPVMFGDHSNEPVPFAVAHVRHVVQSLGGDSVIRNIPLEPIPLPDVEQPPSYSALCSQGRFQDTRRKAAWAGQPWIEGQIIETYTLTS
eukprot:gene6636-3293_t